MIQFQNVNKDFKDNDFAIKDLSFQMEPGEFVFLIGPSGSGKTTVIRLLIREELPTSGKIYFDDFDITRLSRNSVYQLRRQIGVVFQDYKLIPDKTVYENVAFAMEVAGRTNAEIDETVPYLLDIVGLAPRANAFPDHLSGGEKQRVAIARAVSNNPRVLIADEPTGNLDPGAAWDIVQILSKINNWGTTVIMSTHGTDIVNTLNKRVIQMEDGQITRDDNEGKYEITSSYESSVVGGDVKPPSKKPKKSSDKKKGKGMIQVNLRKQDEKEPKRRFSLFGKGKKQKKISPETDVEIIEETVMEGTNSEVLEVADETTVDSLDLPKQVIADLKSAGYADVEDIISDGPEKLSDQLVIDPEEVRMVAKAITKFIEENGHPALEEEKPRPKPISKKTKSKKK